MKFFSLFKKDKELVDETQPNPEKQEETSAAAPEDEVEEPIQEEITLGTKIKVVAALAVVGLATGVAYWVQEPSDIKIDVLGSDQVASEESMAQDEVQSTLVSQADEVPSTVVQEVSIVDFTFTPANLTVEPGTTVIWTNMDAVAHTVTSDFFTSNTLNSGDSYAYTFDQEGTYDYFCSIHPQMKGKITVSAVAGQEPLQTEQLPQAEEQPSLMPETQSLPTGETLTPELLSVQDELLPAAQEPEAVTLDAEQLLSEAPTLDDGTIVLSLPEEEAVHTAAADESPQKLTKSGPEDIFYVALFLGILYFTKRRRFQESR